MEFLDHFLVKSHAISGALVLLAGLLAIIARKRKGLHTTVGRLYFWGMMWVCASAWLTISFFRFNLFLLVVGVFSFYLTFSGYRVLKRRQLGEQTWVDWTAAIISALMGVGLMGFGVAVPFLYGWGVSLAYPLLCMLFGWFTFSSAWTDIKIFRASEMDSKMWWWYHHMQAMLGSYIAAVTAFVVQSGHRFLPDFGMSWLYWVLPGVIGGIFIGRWIRKYRKQFGDSVSRKEKTKTTPRSMKKGLELTVIFLLLTQMVHAQLYVEKETRHRFAQITLGVDVQSGLGGQTRYIDAEGIMQNLDFDMSPRARIIIGGTHFWGHADFHVAFPVYGRTQKSGEQEIAFGSGVETVFKYYPLRIESGKVRPFFGVSLAPYVLEQYNENLIFENGPEKRFTRLPLMTGLTFNKGAHLLEASLMYNYDNELDYYISRDVKASVETSPFFLSVAYKYMFDTTVSAEEDWESGRTAKVTDVLAERGDLSNFFVGIGFSSAWWTGSSSYIEDERPFLEQHRLNVMPDFSLGYYWHKPDLNAALSYRSYHNEQQAYGVAQKASRRALTLEVTKSLGDYHGFVPFIGPALSYESLRAQEVQGSQTVFDESEEKLTYGLTFGWDIRPNRLQWFILRTNLRYFPDLQLDLENGKAISFDNIEFNFIQMVIYPERIW